MPGSNEAGSGVDMSIERDGKLSVGKPLGTVPTTEVEGAVVTGADGEDDRGREAGRLPINGME